MFNFLARFKTPPDDLLTSRLCNERTFYSNFISDLKKCQNEVMIESPYVTCKRVSVLTPTFKKLLKQGVKITINTRNPKDHDTYLRIQSRMATNQLRFMGVRVNFFSDYRHRKIAVLDKRILWEGSLNILSQNYSREVMRRTESDVLVLQMVRFLRLT